jgi:hypothetical protein
VPHADASGLTIGTQPTFDLARSPLKIHVDIYDRDPGGTYCTDVFSMDPPKPVVWRGSSGTAVITLSPLSADEAPESAISYHVSVRLERLVLRGPSAESVTGPQPIVLSGRCCWFGS